MVSRTPAFSARFRRAARAERDRLVLGLGTARTRARDREGDLAAAEAEVEALEARFGALESLLGEPAPDPPEGPVGLRRGSEVAMTSVLYGGRVAGCGCRGVPDGQHLPGCPEHRAALAPLCAVCG